MQTIECNPKIELGNIFAAQANYKLAAVEFDILSTLEPDNVELKKKVQEYYEKALNPQSLEQESRKRVILKKENIGNNKSNFRKKKKET